MARFTNRRRAWRPRCRIRFVDCTCSAQHRIARARCAYINFCKLRSTVVHFRLRSLTFSAHLENATDIARETMRCTQWVTTSLCRRLAIWPPDHPSHALPIRLLSILVITSSKPCRRRTTSLTVLHHPSKAPLWHRFLIRSSVRSTTNRWATACCTDWLHPERAAPALQLCSRRTTCATLCLRSSCP